MLRAEYPRVSFTLRESPAAYNSPLPESYDFDQIPHLRAVHNITAQTKTAVRL